MESPVPVLDCILLQFLIWLSKISKSLWLLKIFNKFTIGLGAQMKNKKNQQFSHIFLITIFLVFGSTSFADKTPQFDSLKNGVQKYIKGTNISEKDWSLYITTLEGDHAEVILDINSKKKMIPASVTKILTAATTLEAFPPGYKFKTQLLKNADHKISDGVLKGSIYLKGGGDPSFVSENMWFLVNAFLRSGIKKIEGDLIVDDSLFDSIRFDGSRQENRVDRAYDAPVGAMSFNWNSVNIFVRPGTKGSPAQVFLDPNNSYLKLNNTTVTTSGSDQSIVADRKNNLISVSGKLGTDAKEVVIFKSITEPDLWAGENLKSFFKQRSIEVTGDVKSGSAPTKSELLAESESKPIETVLADMNKFSNNYVAEMLTKNIASQNKTPGTLSQGIKAINEHMRKLDVPIDQYEIYNPSGLTRDNKMSSFALWKVLEHLKNDFRVYPEFLTSLPISGIDGTLKKRMKNSPAERWVRAKTGFLTGVVSLAGYAGRSDGRVFTFSFIYNGSLDEARIRNTFDQILIHLVK